MLEESGSRKNSTMPDATSDDDTFGDYLKETDNQVDDTSSEQRFSWIFTAVTEI